MKEPVTEQVKRAPLSPGEHVLLAAGHGGSTAEQMPRKNGVTPANRSSCEYIVVDGAPCHKHTAKRAAPQVRT